MLTIKHVMNAIKVYVLCQQKIDSFVFSVIMTFF